MRSSSRLTSGRRSTPRTTLKIAALAPMPSASVTTTVAARPLARRSERRANRMSRPRAAASSSQRGRQTLRIDSRVSVTLPNSFRAARRAEAGSSPRSMRSLTLRARWLRISSSSSSSPGFMLSLAARRVHDASDRVHELRPPVLLARQLSLAGRRQPVVLGPLVRLADVPLGLEPSALLEAVERGVERTGFDLEQAVGLRADRLADAVAVLRAPLQGPEDEHVEGALEELQARFVRAFGHRCRQSTALDVGCLQLVPGVRGRAASAACRARIPSARWPPCPTSPACPSARAWRSCCALPAGSTRSRRPRR